MSDNNGPQWAAPDGVVSEETARGDITRKTWGVFVSDDGVYRDAATIPDVFKAFGWDTDSTQTQKTNLAQLINSPDWGAAPASLRAEASRWLAGH